MPTPFPDYVVRSLKKEEIPKVLELARAEGRHMGTAAEIESWLTYDNECIHVAANTHTGEILGCCSGTRLSDQHGYVGMYIVRPEYRSLGIGKKVWNAAIEHLGDRNKGLSAVDSLFPVYRDKAGFSVVADWTVDLYRSDNPLLVVPPLDKAGVTVPFLDEPMLLEQVLAYDRSLHSYDRAQLVTLALLERDAVSRVVVYRGRVCGYGCIKPNLQGLWIVSPLYADTPGAARVLLASLLGSLTYTERQRGVVVKVPSTNTASAAMLKDFGFAKQSYFLRRCYTKWEVEVPLSRIFAIHTSVFCTE